MANELKTAEMLNSKVTSDKQENVQSQNNPSNRDVNGVNDKNALTRVNDSKTVPDKKPTANGSIKPPSSLPELKKEKSALKTPTKKISPKSPEISSANSLGDKKKVPMNKVQVGAAPSPNLKVVRSKIGSLENYTHKPGGGKVKIENRKLEWKVQPKIEAKNDKYVPTGGDKKITQVKLQWSAKSKIGSLENATHKPGGGDKKIESVKLDFKDKAKPKVGSKDNIKHVPGGGTVKKTTDVDAKSTSPNIEDQKLDIKAQSKVGSLDNVKHKPGGGDKKIFDDKEYLKQTALTNESSKANSVTTSGSQALEDPQICSRDSQQKENQLAASDVITPQNLDKPFKDYVKPKDEPKNNGGKRSQSSTPKKPLSAETKSTSTITNRPTGGDKIAPEKIVQKSDTKIDQKSKQDSMPQLKPELKKIPSKDEINLKSKVPVAQPRELVKMASEDKIQDGINVKDRVPAEQSHKLDLEHVIKSDGKIVLDKNTSVGKNLSENKPDSIKVVNNEKNNTNVGTVTIDKNAEKSSQVQLVSKIGSENESNLITKPAVELVILKKQNSQSKIEPKLNPDTKPTVEVGLLKKQDSKSKIETKLNHDKKPATEIELLKKQDSKSKIETKLNPGTKPVVEIGLLKKQDSKPKIELKSRLDIDNKAENKESNMQISKSTQLESDSNNSKVSTKNQTQSLNNAELNRPSLDCNVKDSDLKNGSINQNLTSKVETKTIKNKDEPKLPSTEHLENVTKDQSHSETVNNQAEKPNIESNFTKINEPSKSSTVLNSKEDDEKSKSLKTDKNQNDIVIEGTKLNSEKFSQPEMKQTNETFSSFSKSDTEFRPLNSTIQSNPISESKVTTVPVREEKHPEKFSQPEMKQTTETFSPLSKSDTESKPSTSESKVTNKIVPEEKLPSLKQPENPNDNEISTVSSNVGKDEKSESSKNKISEVSSNLKS